MSNVGAVSASKDPSPKSWMGTGVHVVWSFVKALSAIKGAFELLKWIHEVSQKGGPSLPSHFYNEWEPWAKERMAEMYTQASFLGDRGIELLKGTTPEISALFSSFSDVASESVFPACRKVFSILSPVPAALFGSKAYNASTYTKT